MHNISLASDDVILNPGGSYYVIDTLYLNDIRENLPALPSDGLEAFIRQNIFPDAGYPFALIDTHQYTEEIVVRVGNISAVSDQFAEADIDACFVTDTGLIAFIRKEIFIDLVAIFDFYDLVDVDDHHEPVNVTYWNRIAGRYHPNDIALMLSPGVGSGYDFVGSGLYAVMI